MDKAQSTPPPPYEETKTANSFDHTIDGYDISLQLLEGLMIKITNQQYYEESSINYDESAPIFQGHTILSKPLILYKVLVDAFQGNNKVVSVDCLFSRHETTIKVKFETPYICDEMTMVIPVQQKNSDQRITQLIEEKVHLEEKVKHLSEELLHVKSTMEQQIQETIRDLSKEKVYREEEVQHLSEELKEVKDLLEKSLTWYYPAGYDQD